MIGRLFYALRAASVVAAAAAAASYGVTRGLPQGPARQGLECWVTAPGQAVYAKIKEDPAVRKKVEAGQERLEKAGLDLKSLQDSLVGPQTAKGAAKARSEARRHVHLYNVGAWAGAGLALCLAFALLFGVGSIADALALGLKVTLALVFLQGALILGGVLALSRLGG
jgi:hypothetical protein